jgi:hypothetical protein
MDALRATAATAAPIATAATTAASTGASTTTAATEKKADTSFAALYAEAKKDLKTGEKLTKVDGHEFARIKGGQRDDMCVNLSGNDRSGQAFDLVWRNGRQFHVYGDDGPKQTVVEVGRKKTGTTTSTDTTKAVDTTKAAEETSTTGSSADSATTSGTTAASTGTGGTAAKG